jgi:hypothetical protein
MTLIKIHVQIHNYFFLNENSIVKMFNTQNVVSTFVLVNQALLGIRSMYSILFSFEHFEFDSRHIP